MGKVYVDKKQKHLSLWICASDMCQVIVIIIQQHAASSCVYINVTADNTKRPIKCGERQEEKNQRMSAEGKK